jgi:hypothetical protein
MTALSLLAASTLSPLLVAAQDSQPATTSAPTVEELPPDILAGLSTLEDFSYDFDRPAYYALLAFVKHSPRAPGFARPPMEVSDWQELVQRPSEFRGLPITIEGVIGRNKDPYINTRHPELGQVWQLELGRPDQATSCTVICTTDVSDLPLGATIRITGYFVKINRYPTQSKAPGLAALLIAQGPDAVIRATPQLATSGGLDWRWLTAAIVAALVITVVLLRWSRHVARHDMRGLEARHAAPINLADDLARWSQRERPDE